MARPIALLTDFGLQDAYAGLMRGVLLSRCPEARVVDLTHGVPPQDVRAGALLLRHALSYFPPNTVFLAVVDPGVGGERRPLCARSGGRMFVGPDNGLLWPAAHACGEPEFFHLDRPEQWLPDRSATFHGRDLFAPVAARLADGAPPEACGSRIADAIPLVLPGPRSTPEGLEGEVILVDHYGNAVTSIRPADLAGAGGPTFIAGDRVIGAPASHYGAVPLGDPLVVLGSMGFYEVAIHGGNAAEILGLRIGAAVFLRFQALIS